MPPAVDVPGFLRSVAYFAELPPERLAALGGELRWRRYEAGEPILTEGEPCRGLHMIAEGRVKVFKTTDSGRQQVLRILGAGRTFNDVPVFDGGPNPGNVAALANSRIALLPTARMLWLVRNESAVAAAAVHILAARLRGTTLMVEDLALRGVTARIARLLLERAARKPEPGPASLPLTQKDLAGMVGSVREVVHRTLKMLEQEGAVRVGRGSIAVLEPAILERWAARTDGPA
jgi:CRP/FNR family transcriptional regulator